MHILVVNVFFAPQSIGGATRVVQDNVRDFLSSDEVSGVSVFCSTQGGREPHWARTYGHEGARVTSVTTILHQNTDFMLHDPKMQEVFGRVLDFERPDIVHFHCIQRLTGDIALAAKERGVPYVITMHDGWWISDHQFLVDEAGEVQTYDYQDPSVTRGLFGDAAVLRQETLGEVLRGAARVLTVSETFKAVIEAAGISNVLAIPNGVAPRSAHPKVSSDKTRIGYLAGAAHYKGYHHLKGAIEAGNYSNIELVVVDHSMRHGDVVKEVWGATQVERIGFVPQDEVDALYRRLHAVIVPSIWPESFGLIAREALQTRAWLFASNRGAASEDVLEGVNGHVFDPGDRQDFARLLSLVNDNPEKYTSPCAESSVTSASEQAEKLIALYKDILSDAASKPQATGETRV